MLGTNPLFLKIKSKLMPLLATTNHAVHVVVVEAVVVAGEVSGAAEATTTSLTLPTLLSLSSNNNSNHSNFNKLSNHHHNKHNLYSHTPHKAPSRRSSSNRHFPRAKVTAGAVVEVAAVVVEGEVDVALVVVLPLLVVYRSSSNSSSNYPRNNCSTSKVSLLKQLSYPLSSKAVSLRVVTSNVLRLVSVVVSVVVTEEVTEEVTVVVAAVVAEVVVVVLAADALVARHPLSKMRKAVRCPYDS